MRLPLDPVVFWRLRAVCADTQRLQTLAQATLDALKVAQQKQDDAVTQVALLHGFDPHRPFVLDDASESLTLPDGVGTPEPR